MSIMKLLVNAFLLSIILFVSISLGNFLLMWLYIGLQMSSTMENGLNLMGKSIAAMDNIAIPIGII
ncbi:hypothetical protein LCGC14_2616460 [marine sediment metagenome]|uniref:Uncharacterized protein n=1 Tax=marine sediment metagenome TaxID=412755 RepID=A0A0F9A4L1_9ZZZZ